MKMEMSKTLKKIIVILTFQLFNFSTGLALEQAGQDIAVLKAGVGARPLGMGGAFTAIADNADAAYWNPGGLGLIDKNEITTMQTRLSTDADHYYISYVRPALGGTLGISWIQVGLGNITQTSAEVDINNEVQNLSVFSYFSNAYMLSYGREVNDYVSLGLTAKYLTSDMFQISGGQAHGYSVTPGILISFGKKDKDDKRQFVDQSEMLRARTVQSKGFVYPENERSRAQEPTLKHKMSQLSAKSELLSRLTMGIKIDELLNRQSWGTGTVEQVPAKLRVGFAYRSPNPGLFALDFSQTLRTGYAAEAAVGYEWAREGLALRCGYNNGWFSAGAGFQSGQTKIDYAYVTQHDLSRENVHRVSLTGVW
ncbi:hypothetical protein A3F86_01865 [candidate division WOR-1 bacterium RIFCSPLOWO2_12_FULL_45_9]|uniref:PorV/PorQ family protein n=1 Tax=candidate division WOR-1 bacterium RIFCSPLOWO2_12_FULL_45_9 TaxID=1802568 RepID=A0A1F4RNB3_UNCSA|nr:MAG: hypothetical protein A3F86_01865 [candidate division WOR-1 bacterium RIFCSPLOWO2_12_FULL_45_9]